MNRTSLSVATTDPGELSDVPDLAAGDLAAAANWLDRIELVSRSLPRLPGLAAALHWLGLQLAGPLAASRFQVWQIHDWRDGAGLVQPWLESDDQAGVQRIDLAQLDLLREGEGALGLALSSGRAAVAQVRMPADERSGDSAALPSPAAPSPTHEAPAAPAATAPAPVAAVAGASVMPGSTVSPSARLCLAVGLHDAAGEPFAAIEWWLNDAPVADALPALTMLARLVAARAPVWVMNAATATRELRSAATGAVMDDAGAGAAAQHPRGAANPAQELALAMAAALPASLVLLDTELNVLMVNRHAQREFGLLPEQASGQGLAQLFGAAAGQDLAAGAAQSSTRGGVVEQQLVFAARQGPRRVLARSSALCDETGQVKLLMCQLQSPGRDQLRLPPLRESTTLMATGQSGSARVERQRHADTPARGQTYSAGLPLPAAGRPVSVPPSLSSVRAASVMLAPPAARSAVVSRYSTEAPPDVLVIDDHAVNQELMAQMLLHLGCRARCAGSAEAGLAELCVRPADLVLMDIRMPGMDGLQALGWIRQGPSQQFALRTPATLPVVAVTAHAVAGDADRCIAHGFDAYLAKPCRLEDLRLVLEGLLAWCPAGATLDAGDTEPDQGANGLDAPAAGQPKAATATAGPGAAATARRDQASSAAAPTAGPIESTSRMGEGIPVFDQQALHRLRALDPSGQNQLLNRVMKAFELSLQRLSTQLCNARQQQDVSAVRHAAHTLKSSAASVGALRLSGLCLDVESALRRAGASFDATPVSAGEALAEPVDRLLEEINRVQAALPQWFADDGGLMPVAPGADQGAAASGANA